MKFINLQQPGPLPLARLHTALRHRQKFSNFIYNKGEQQHEGQFG